MNTRAAAGTDKDRLSIGQVFFSSLNKDKAQLHPVRPAKAKLHFSVYEFCFFIFHKYLFCQFVIYANIYQKNFFLVF